MEDRTESSTGNKKAKKLRQSERREQLNKERYQKLKKLILDKPYINRFYHRYSH